MIFFFFQAEDGIRDNWRDWSSDVCSSDLGTWCSGEAWRGSASCSSSSPPGGGGGSARSRMRRLTSGWTDRHLPVALALVVAVVGGGGASAPPLPSSVGAGPLLALTARRALFLDALAGLLLRG